MQSATTTAMYGALGLVVTTSGISVGKRGRGSLFRDLGCLWCVVGGCGGGGEGRSQVRGGGGGCRVWGVRSRGRGGGRWGSGGWAGRWMGAAWRCGRLLCG